ncbi:unnamed protein product, partial [Rotaria sordida]
MDSQYFIGWIRKTSFRLREDHGPNVGICIVVDNAPWHSELTDDTKPAKRSYNKAQVQQWLSKHYVIFDSAMTKAELLELASANRPTRHYK